LNTFSSSLAVTQPPLASSASSSSATGSTKLASPVSLASACMRPSKRNLKSCTAPTAIAWVMDTS
jgi:hypothetical protein